MGQTVARMGPSFGNSEAFSHHPKTRLAPAQVIRTRPPPNTLAPGSPYHAEIISIEITGDVAVVKVEDDCFGTSFTDYLTLIKHENRWQIVMKVFFDHANALSEHQVREAAIAPTRHQGKGIWPPTQTLFENTVKKCAVRLNSIGLLQNRENTCRTLLRRTTRNAIAVRLNSRRKASPCCRGIATAQPVGNGRRPP